MRHVLVKWNHTHGGYTLGEGCLATFPQGCLGTSSEPGVQACTVNLPPLFVSEMGADGSRNCPGVV